MDRILALAAYDRSGTTFLGKYIHYHLPSSMFLGEVDIALRFLKGNPETHPCSCGLTVMNCPVWSAISPIVKSSHSDYDIMVHQVFNKLLALEQPRLVIDSSKALKHMKSLVKAMKSNLILLHLVRNPKGVIYSRMKARMRRVAKGTHPKPHIAKHYNTMMVYDIIAWNLSNIYIETILKWRTRKHYRIYYEKAASELPVFMEKFIMDASFMRSTNNMQHHIFHGNRNRYTVETEIVIDESWKKNLSTAQKMVVDMLTWPVRTLFGYRF